MQTIKMTPKDFFLYAGAMVTLYWSAGSLIALLFAISNALFPDTLGTFDSYSSGMRFSIASLVIVFPVSVFLFIKIKKDVQSNPEKLLLSIRRWFFALTIFITAVAIIADGIYLLNTFLGGEVTARFVSKVLSVLVVSGLVFWYSLLEFRMQSGSPVQKQTAFVFGVPILVLVAVIYGFTVMGSPATARSLRLDAERVHHIETIQWQVVNYWQQKERFPKALEELEDPISGYKNPVDPETGVLYEYIMGEGLTFSLCATFELPTPSATTNATDAYLRDRPNQGFTHDAGYTCFERTVDPELYPPSKPILLR